MTARERALDFMLRWQSYQGPPIMAEDITNWIEHTIIAAEAEAKKAEREACAMIVQEAFERERMWFANLKEYTDAPHCILEDLMNKIRARKD